MEVIEAEPYQIIVKSFYNILQKIYRLEKIEWRRHDDKIW